MYPVSRRNFLQQSASFSSFSLASLFLSCGFTGKSSGIRYLDSLQHVVTKIRNKEISRIRDAANLFAHALIIRNRCFLAVSDPANPGYFAEGSPGLPPVFVLIRSKEMAGTIREGDALLTTIAGEIPRQAKKNKVSVVGLTSPGVLDDYSPEQQKKHSGLMKFGDSASLLLHTHLSHMDNPVRTHSGKSEISAGTGPALLAVITALAGEIYRRSEGIGRTGSYPSHDAILFLDAILHRLKSVIKERENLHKAALLAGEKIHRGGTLWLYDGRGIFARETREDSGSPGFAKLITPVGITDGTLREKDALIFASLTSNAPEEIHLIRMARGITNGIVTICPHKESGGYRLYRESPSGLDNWSPEKEGIVQFDNGARTYLHTGAVINCGLFWALIGEINDFLDSRK
ncbi:MAG: hypothetical protein WCU00_05235 [Candidatus Latescibacterota bacterium]